jgi:protein TonB
MAFADETSLAPVAAFGGRRQLFHRIVMLSKEGVMSSRRLVITCAVVAAALAAGTWQAVGAFPLTAEPQVVRQEKPGPLEQRANPITPENPIPRRVNFEAPAFPAEAEAAGARGSVTLLITLDELGRVMEARRVELDVTTTSPSAAMRLTEPSPGEQRFLINGDQYGSDRVRAVIDSFEAEATRAVGQWRYEPPAKGPISFPVTVHFSAADTRAEQWVAPARRTTYTSGRGGGRGREVAPDGAIRVGGNIKSPAKVYDVRPVYPDIAKAARVSGVVILEVRVAPDGTVEDAMVLRSIPLLDQAAIDAVRQWRFTPTLLNGQPVPVMLTVTVNFTPDKEPEASAAPAMEQAVEVTPEGRAPRVIKEVNPVYPDDAREAKVEGMVEVEATIGTDGKVTDVRVIRSVPMLDDAAVAAVRAWEFSKVPQPVAVTIELSFRLARTNR